MIGHQAVGIDRYPQLFPIPAEPFSIKKFKKNVRLLKKFEDVLGAITQAKNAPEVAIDLETVGFRPYGKDASIICMSLATTGMACSFPVQPKDPYWSHREVQTLRDAVRSLLVAPNTKIAFNAAFELEWLMYWVGKKIAHSAVWLDPMAQAFCLDPRKGGHSLDFMCCQELGFSVKSLTQIKKNEIADMPVEQLLEYNAYDAKSTLLLADKLN